MNTTNQQFSKGDTLAIACHSQPKGNMNTTRQELLQLLNDIKSEARYNTKWNSGEPEANPSKLPTLTPVLWHRLCALTAPATSNEPNAQQSAKA